MFWYKTSSLVFAVVLSLTGGKIVSHLSFVEIS